MFNKSCSTIPIAIGRATFAFCFLYRKLYFYV